MKAKTDRQLLWLVAIVVLVGAAFYLVWEAAESRSDHAAPPWKPAGVTEQKSGPRDGSSFASGRVQSGTSHSSSIRLSELENLRERWLELKPLGNAAINEQNALAAETSKVLLCSEEAIDLMKWLEDEGLRYGALRIKIELERLLKSPRGAELREILVGLPALPRASGRDGHYLVQALCDVAGQACPADEFEAFHAALKSPAYAQEARLGHNTALMRTDPHAGIVSTLELLGSEVHSLSKNDHLNRQLREELPPEVNYADLERLLPVSEGKLSDSPGEWSPVEFARDTLFTEWAKIDPVGAIDYVLQHQERMPPRLAGSIATSAMHATTGAALELVDRFPDGPFRDQAALGALYYLAESNPDRARQLAATIRDSALREQGLEIIGSPVDAEQPAPE